MNIALSDLYGKKIALLIWYMTEDQETRAAIVTGVAFLHQGQLSLHRGHILPPLTVPLAMVWRARLVPDDLKDILQMADYCIQGTVTEFELVRKKEDVFF